MLWHSHTMQALANPLPSGYAAVDWLESTGTQYVDTGYVPATTADRVVFDFSITSSFAFANTAQLFGCYSLNVVQYSLGINSQTSLRVPSAVNSATTVTLSQTIAAGTWHRISYGPELLLDGAAVAQPPVAFFRSARLSVYLFGRNQGSAAPLKTAGVRCTGVEIYDGDAIRRRFVPCVRLADDKPGLYDLCGSVSPATDSPFYVNSGTGEFLTSA